MSELLDNLDSLARQGVSLWAEGSRIRFRAAKGVLTEQMKEWLAANKNAVVSAWRERAVGQVSSHPTTHAQRALWFLYQDKPDSAAYNVAVALRIRSAVDLRALQLACQALLDRHSSLRTTYAMEGARLVQRVHGSAKVAFWTHDRCGVNLQKLRDEVIELSHVPFELENGPLMRVDLFSRADKDHVLLLTVHHIAVDGWSVLLLLEDLRNNYYAESNEGPAPPPRSEYDVPAFARWQEEMLSGPEGRAHELYWTEQFAGEIPTLELPTDRPRSPITTVRGASCPIDLGADVSEAVRALAAAAGTTPFVVLLAAYHALLHRYSGQTQLIVGSPTYGRDRAEFADVIGDFINMIPLKADVSGDPTFLELLAQLRGRVIEGIQHQDYPFALLVEKLHPARDPSRTPIFQTIFILQKFKQPAGLAGARSHSDDHERLTLEPFPIPQQEGQFDLAVELADTAGVYQGDFKYNSDLYAASTAATLVGHYLRLLQAAVSSPDTQISRLVLLSPAEREQLVIDFNSTERSYPVDATVVSMFGAQVARRSEAVAVSFEGSQLTYAELDSRSNQLARHLQSLGVGPESLVGICLDRGLEMMVGLLGILKTGAAYVPLDPGFPPHRLRYMAEDSEARVLVTQAGFETLFSGLPLAYVLVDRDQGVLERESRSPLPPLAQSAGRAYVIYTSGSTGQPKGVEIEHRSLANFLFSMAEEPGLSESDVLLAVTSLSFDIAGLELFLPLVCGARVELVSRETTVDGVALARALSTSSATVMQATPAAWRNLLESRWQGDRDLKVLCGGEAMGRDLATRLVSACGAVWNLYGPTETTIWSSVTRIDSDQVTIGRPIANTCMYVLDAHGELVPRGVTGELWIGGDGVARGYLKRPQLTAERFRSDPFRGKGRIYRTGDLARYLPDGRIECLGRSDDQVKIRGHRIELGEIESVLGEHPRVTDCAVVVREVGGDRQLVAYVTGSEVSAETCRGHLRGRLPEYMVPSLFVFVEHLPLTPNGKVDRKALPTPEGTASRTVQECVPPRNQVERIMAEIWADVLGLKEVGVFEHFFELGGHSLSATRLIARLRTAFQVDLPLRSIFLEPTIAELSKHILYDDLLEQYYYVSHLSSENRLVPAQPKGSRPPLFLVAGYMNTDDTLLILSRIFPFLGMDQPVFGFQPRWLDGHSDGYSSVQEVAVEFLSELRAFQPEGPYLLGGDCVGGVIALEMARELLRQGQEVGLLVMFDTERPTAFRNFVADVRIVWHRVVHISEVIGGVIRGQQSSRIQLFKNIVNRKLGKVQPGPQGGGEAAPRNVYRLKMAYQRMIYQFRPPKYPGRITLIVNEQHHKIDKTMGWNGVAQGGLEIISTPGDHWNRYTLHGKEFAEQLLGLLERARLESEQRAQRSAERTTGGDADTGDADKNMVLTLDATRK